MNHWLNCDVIIADRPETLWLRVPEGLSGPRLRVVFAAPEVEYHGVVEVQLDRCVAAIGVPPRGALIGWVVGASGGPRARVAADATG